MADDGLDQIIDGYLAQSKANAVFGATENPEKAAKSLSVGGQLGVPAEVVHLDPNGYDDILKQRQASQAVDASSALQSYLAQTPLHGEVSAGDFDKLSGFEKAGQAFLNGIQEGPLSNERGRLGASAIALHDAGLGTKDVLDKADTYTKALQAIQAPTGAYGMIQRATSMGSSLLDSLLKEGITGAIAGGTAGSIEPGFGTAAGAGIGAGIGLATSQGIIAQGNSYIDSGLWRDKNGQPLPEGVRQLGATTVGLGIGLLTAFGGKVLSEGVKTGFANLMTDSMSQAYTNSAFAKAVGGAVVAGGEGALFGAMSSAFTQLTDLTTKLAGGDFATILNDPAERAAAVGSLAQSMVDGAIGFMTTHIPQVGVSAVVDGIKIVRAKTNADNFSKAMDAAQESETAKRSPQAFQAFASSVLGEKDFSIPAEALAKIYESKGVKPGPGDGVLGDVVPDVAGQLASGLASGGDITVRMAAYAAKIDPEIDKLIRPDVRAEPSDLTLNEAAELSANPPAYGSVPKPDAQPAAVEGGVKSDNSVVELSPQVPPVKGAKPPVEPTESAKMAAATTLDTAASVRKELWLDPLFKDAASAGMTEAEFAKYSKKLQVALDVANTKALTAAEHENGRRQTQQWKDNELAVREEVITAFNNRPDIKATEFLKNGKLLGEEHIPIPEEAKVKLDRKAVDELSASGDGTWKLLPKGVTAAKDGVHPDEIAPLFGYPDGRTMIKDLAALEQSRGEKPLATFRRELINTETASRMETKYGKLDENIQREAAETALHKSQSDLLHTDLGIIAKQMGGAPPFELGQLETWAANEFSKLPVGRAGKLQGFLRQTGSAGRKAELALLAGDLPKAFAAKQQQLLAHLLAREASAFDKERTSGNRLMGRFADSQVVKTVEQPYTNEIHAILSRLGIPVKRSLGELSQAREGQTLAQFVEDKFAEGREIAMPDFLLDDTFKASMKDLTVEQYLGVKDAIASLAENGKDEKLIRVGEELQDRAEIIERIKDNLDTRPQRKDVGMRASLGTAIPHFFYGIDASLVRMEKLMDDFDLHDNSGPFNETVFRPLSQAKFKEDDMHQELGRQLKDLRQSKKWRKSLEDEIQQSFFKDPLTGKPFELNRQDLLGIALNFGNKSNMDKFTHGYTNSHEEAQVLEAQVKSLLDKELRPEDVNWLNGIWKLAEPLGKEAQALARRMSGVGPELIKAEGFPVAAGKLEGGYYPVIYDEIRSNIGARRDGEGPYSNPSYFRATPPKAYTKARVEGFAEPLKVHGLIDELPQRLRAVVHDLAFREPVVNAQKVLGDKDVRRAINLHYGPEYTAQLRPWLQYVADGRTIDDPAMNTWAGIARKVRSNVIIQSLGFNLKAILTPIMGNLTDPGYVSTAARMFLNPKTFYDKWTFAVENSGELRHRMENSDRDVSEQLQRNLGHFGWRQEAYRASMYALVKVDQMFATISWHDEYAKGLIAGKSHDDAVYGAEKRVRSDHGSQGITDLPAVMRGGQGWKMMTMFYGYFNTMYNRQRDIVGVYKGAMKLAKEGEWSGARRDFGKVLSDSIAFVLAPALIGAAFYNPKKDDQSWGNWASQAMVEELAGTVPLVRDVAAYALHGFNSTTPVNSMITAANFTAQDISRALGISEKDVSDKWIKHSIQTVGYTFGLPLGQPARIAQYLWDLGHGNMSHDQSLNDVLYGLIYGQERPQK